jgi:DNA-binding NarL/FixJ family response regulator
MNTAEPLRILLVEDSDSDAFLVRTAVSRLPQRCELVHVQTVAEAREALERHSFDILLADLNLPDSAHAATLEYLLEARHKVATIALNSCDDDTLSQTCAAAGIGCYSKQQLLSPAFGNALREQIENSMSHSLRGE